MIGGMTIDLRRQRAAVSEGKTSEAGHRAVTVIRSGSALPSDVLSPEVCVSVDYFPS